MDPPKYPCIAVLHYISVGFLARGYTAWKNKCMTDSYVLQSISMQNCHVFSTMFLLSISLSFYLFWNSKCAGLIFMFFFPIPTIFEKDHHDVRTFHVVDWCPVCITNQQPHHRKVKPVTMGGSTMGAMAPRLKIESNLYYILTAIFLPT